MHTRYEADVCILNCVCLADVRCIQLIYFLLKLLQSPRDLLVCRVHKYILNLLVLIPAVHDGPLSDG